MRTNCPSLSMYRRSHIVFARRAFVMVLAALLCPAVSLAEQAKYSNFHVLDNGAIRLTFDAGKGTFDASLYGATGMARPVLSDVAISNLELRPGGKFSSAGTKADQVSSTRVDDGTGAGRRLDIAYTLDGAKLVVSARIFDEGTGVLFEVRVVGRGKLTGRGLVPSGSAAIGNPGDCRVLNFPNMWRASVRDLNRNVESTHVIAAWNEKAKLGLVVGALTPETDNRAGLSAVGQAVRFEARANCNEDFAATLDFDAPAQAGFYVGVHENIFDGLETYGRVAKAHAKIKLFSPVPAGWCSWDCFGTFVTPEQVLGVVAEAQKLGLAKYGFEWIQIDDGWQRGYRCSGDWEPNARWEKVGMKDVAETIRKAGFRPGVWLGPWGDEDWEWDRRNYKSGTWQYGLLPAGPNHVELKVDQNPRNQYDVALPAFQQWQTELFEEMCGQWTYEYIKADFLTWNGDKGRGRDRNAHQVYRDGLRAMRKGMGPDVYFMTCISPEFKCIGIADGQRIGSDVNGRWNGINPTLQNIARKYFIHNNLFINDPDQIHVHKQVTLEQARAWASVVALSGGVTITGDDITKLPPERLDILRRICPSYEKAARPLDLFEVTDRSPLRSASLYDLKVDRPSPYDRQGKAGDRPVWHVVGLFNWTNNSAVRKVDLASLDWPEGTTGEFLVYEFWTGEFLGQVKSLSATLPQSSCRVYAVRPAVGRPQVLSTNRHVTGGAVDILAEQWDAKTKKLSGKARPVKGDPYTLIIHVPEGFKPKQAFAEGAAVKIEKKGDSLLVVSFTAPADEVDWSVQF